MSSKVQSSNFIIGVLLRLTIYFMLKDKQIINQLECQVSFQPLTSTDLDISQRNFILIEDNLNVTSWPGDGKPLKTYSSHNKYSRS